MDPAQLNQATHSLSEPYLFIPEQEALESWLPLRCGRNKSVSPIDDSDFKDNSKPVAIYPSRYNPRLVVQRGVFTVHGIQEDPIDQVFLESAKGSSPRIQMLVIDPKACHSLLRDLTALGVNQAALFPEPDSVAADLKRMYKVG